MRLIVGQGDPLAGRRRGWQPRKHAGDAGLEVEALLHGGAAALGDDGRRLRLQLLRADLPEPGQ